MKEHKITVSKELFHKALIKEKKYSEFIDILKILFSQTILIFLIVILIDKYTHNSNIIYLHTSYIYIVVVSMAAYLYVHWRIILKKELKGYTFTAIVSDEGVVTKQNEEFHEWNSYKYFIEYDEYLMIKHKNGGLSFLPKTEELKEIIEFTKTKIPQKI